MILMLGTSYSDLTPALSQNITSNVSSTAAYNTGAGVASGSQAFTNNPDAGNSDGIYLAMDTSDYVNFNLGGSDLVHYSQYRFYLQVYFTTFSANSAFTLSYSTDNITYTP